MILTSLLICSNTLSGLFPDKSISLPIWFQYAWANAVGFILAWYFAMYVQHVYQISDLKWYATKGALYFVLSPFIIIYGSMVFIFKEQYLANRLMVIIPGVYCAIYLVMGVFVHKKYLNGIRMDGAKLDWLDLGAVYLGVMGWFLFAVFIFFGDNQVLQGSAINIGFCFISFSYIRGSVINALQEYTDYQHLKLKKEDTETLKKEVMKSRLQLSKLSLQLAQNSTVTAKLLSKVEGFTNEQKKELQPILISLAAQDKEIYWKTVFANLDANAKGFLAAIEAKYPNLTDSETRLLFLIRQKMDHADISFLLDIKKSSLRTIKSRLKKKMGLEANDDFVKYIEQI